MFFSSQYLTIIVFIYHYYICLFKEWTKQINNDDYYLHNRTHMRLLQPHSVAF